MGTAYSQIGAPKMGNSSKSIQNNNFKILAMSCSTRAVVVGKLRAYQYSGSKKE